MEKPPDKLGRAAILLPVLAFLTLNAVPMLLEPGIRGSLVAALSLVGLLVSGPFATWVWWRRRQKGQPNRSLAIIGGALGFVLSLFTVFALITISEKQKEIQKELEECQRLEAQSPAAQ